METEEEDELGENLYVLRSRHLHNLVIDGLNHVLPLFEVPTGNPLSGGYLVTRKVIGAKLLKECAIGSGWTP